MLFRPCTHPTRGRLNRRDAGSIQKKTSEAEARGRNLWCLLQSKNTDCCLTEVARLGSYRSSRNGPATMRRLPPLNALRVFEVAARLESFTLAASELNVSLGAVSRHIAHLEAVLGN